MRTRGLMPGVRVSAMGLIGDHLQWASLRGSCRANAIASEHHVLLA